MKNKYITAILALSVTLFSSCSWLDVHPVDEVDKASMYATTDGFYNVLNGIYLSLGEPTLYGENLSWGSMEAWGRSYDLDKTLQGHKKFYSLQECRYEDKEILSLSESIWSNMYRNIARLNDFIQQAELKPDTFFTNGLVEKNLLIGEAKGLRAMLHFDLYRIFGQSPAHPTDAQKSYVPYVSVYPSKSNPPTPVNEFVKLLKDDLKSAVELVGTYDNTDDYRMNVLNKDSRFSENAPQWGRFYSQRGIRMNYYALRILQSRVELYFAKTLEDYQNAYEYSQEIHQLIVDKKLTFVSTSKIASEPKLMAEVLFAFHYDLLKEATQDKFDYTLPASYKVEDRSLFTKLSGDRRSSLISNYVLISYTNDLQDKYIPSIRMTEIYYIMTECLVKADKLTDAINLFNDFRKKRGVTSSSAKIPDDAQAEEIIDEIIEDAKREFVGLGQNVFVFKRLNRPITFSEGKDMNSVGNLKLNVPQSESAV